MARRIKFLGLVLLLSGCAQKPASTTAELPRDYFAGKKGCFLLYNVNAKTFEKVIGDENCRIALPACSTFKVPLAVMAFDSGVLKDENTKFKWDGIVDLRKEVNRDHTAKTWMRDSVGWFSQRITPKLGKVRFQRYLDDFTYGNKDLTGGITQAWLVSPGENKPALKISAYEQVDFMKALWSDSLKVNKRAMQLARDLTFLENSPGGFKLHGKTGSNFYDKARKVRLGWFIGHLKNGAKEYVVVTQFSDLAPQTASQYGGPEARELSKQILVDHNLW